MTDLEWRDPLFLIAGLLAPIVTILAARMPSTLTYSSFSVLGGTPRSLRVRLAKLPALLMGLATLALAVALAGPRTGDATTKTQRQGIAIALVVDRSSSMNARDLTNDTDINRLDVVKDVIRSFAIGGDDNEGRPDDLIGLVAFARFADGLCPLTLDHGNLLAIGDDVELAQRGSKEDGTALGEGLALAVERLRDHPAKSKVVILLTDGVNNAGDVDPLQAAELAAVHEIKVYSIGAGTNGFAPFPFTDRFGRESITTVPVVIDEETLRKIARRTGGRYYRATDADGLLDAYREIDALERTEITELRYLQYTEHYATAVIIALSLMALSGIIAGTLLRRLP